LVERHPYGLLFLFICLAYVGTLTDTAFDWISDGQVMFDTAVSLHEFGELGISPDVVDPNTGVNGTTDYFGKYGLGLSLVEQLPLLMVPLVEKAFGEGRSNVLFAMMNLLITALTALLVALCMRDLGYRFKSCALAAVGFAWGTPAWPYTSYDFSEPLQALCVVAAFWFVLRAARTQPSSRIYLVLSGFALGYAVFTKALLLILIPSYGLYLWMRPEASQRQKLRNLGWFVLPLVFWAGTMGALNLHRFGSVFEFGYGGETTRFTTPLLTGLYGLLASPTKGLIFYAPLTLLVPWSLMKFRKSRSRELVFFLSTLGLIVLINSKWWSWEGGISWGPRLLMPVIPLLTICAAMILESGKWPLRLFGVCVAAGALVNLLGVLVHFLVWVNAVGANSMRLPLDVPGRPAYEYVEHDGRRWFRPYNAMWYVPSLSPIRGHAWLLRLRCFSEPFSLNQLDARPPATLPRVSFPPVEIDFAHLKNDFSLSHLRSAHLWLYEVLSHHPREAIFTYSVYGISIERQGDRAVAKGDHERAIECYTRAIQLVPNYASPTLKLSRLRMEQGRVREAADPLLQYLTRGVENREEERTIRLQLAQVYERAGYWDAALEQYRTYLTLGPSEENRIATERHMTALATRHP
jgi:hypothetical protein